MAGKADIRFGTLAAGVLTALIVIVSQLFYFQTAAHHSKKEVKTEQQDSSTPDGTYITLPSSTLPSSSHVVFQQQVFCLFTVLVKTVETSAPDRSVSPTPSRFFRTLFRTIISPNAP
ncbi:hypothetical protein KK062_16145 [Fulvivirgaceae bacterium PWU5]|jgi:hypothetical protein|uniref:Uncharacterized protein n=1 Tax=Dawidia cretensis TaxID=2782350 RepID=A0AAP2DYM1_9BACT|nr:hypothetical protein [Dawidia cretensis]MBT1709776.1 hypothetical protein [Dawidia cretensis]